MDSRESKLIPADGAEPVQCPGDVQQEALSGRAERSSVRSEASECKASSWTESEREMNVGGARSREAEPQGNVLPEKAAQVFSPTVTVLQAPPSPRDTEAFWEMESEQSPFLKPRLPQDYSQHGTQWTQDGPAACKAGGHGCLSRDVLKVGVSLMTSAIFFPLLVWGGYVFLPFDAPLLDSAPLRLVYTLRCSVFAMAPIVLAWLVLGISRVRFAATRPLFDDIIKDGELQGVSVHWRFIADSVSLFLIYFLQLVVMAMYLSQEQLKLLPLLTILFATGRLVYWVSACFGSSIRGFGFGLSFLPSLVMMSLNFYFIFTVEASGSIFSLPSVQQESPSSASRQRFWG